MLGFQSRPVSVEVFLCGEAHGSVIRWGDTRRIQGQGIKEGITVSKGGYAARSDFLLDFSLSRLPRIGPEPGLAGGDRDLRAKFDDAILALHDLDLSAGHIEAEAFSHLRGQGEDAAALQTHVGVVAGLGSHGHTMR